MTQKEIEQAIRDIGLALSASHNTLATDDLNAKETEMNWRIDNNKEIALLYKLARHLGILYSEPPL